VSEGSHKACLYQLDNAGFAIKTRDSLYLIDALHEGSKIYGGLSLRATALIRELAEGLSAPVRLVVTHLHPDHAGAGSIRRFAAETPLEVLAADPEILSWDLGKAQVRLMALSEDYYLGMDRVRPIPLPHVSPERFNILHTALRLDAGGVSVFVSGDGLMDAAIFERNARHIKNTDAAVCLYSYAFTRRNLAFTRAHIAPKTLVVNHFPLPERDEFDSLNRFKAFTARESEGLRILPFVQAGDRLDV